MKKIRKITAGFLAAAVVMLMAGTEIAAAYDLIDERDFIPTEAGQVTVTSMSGDDYEGCGYFPVNDRLRIEWKGFGLQFPDPPFDVELEPEPSFPAKTRYVCICNILFTEEDGKKYAAYKSGLPMQGVTGDEAVFENIAVSDLFDRRYVAYFLGESMSIMQGNQYKRIEVRPDFKAPSISQVTVEDIRNQDGARTGVCIHTEASDDESGLSAEAYSIDGGITWQASPAFNIYRNGTYTVTVRDKTRQTAARTVIVEGIDGTGPVIKEITKSGVGSKNGFAKEVQVKVSAYDEESGLADEAYSFDGGVTFSNRNQITVSANGIIHISVKDAAGNCTAAQAEVTEADNDGPVMLEAQTAPVDGVNGFGTKAEVSFLLSDEASGLAKYPLSFDGGETYTGKMTRTYTENGTYDLVLKDALGNLTNTSFTVGCIDKEAPQVTVGFFSDSISSNGFCREKTVHVEASDEGAGLAELPFSYDKGISWTKEKTKTVKANEKLEIRVRDGLMNTTRKQTEISGIDTEGPAILKIEKELLNQSGDFGTKAIFTVHASDTGAGLAQQAYSFDGGKTYTEDNTIAVEENTKISLVIRDALSNETERELNVTEIDRTAPYGAIAGNPKETVKKNVVLTFTGSDQESGISALWYQSDKIRVRHLLGQYDGAKTVREKATITTNGKYRFIVRDMVGNEAEYTVNVTKIKKATPDDGKDTPDGGGSSGGGSGSGGDSSGGGSGSGGASGNQEDTVIIGSNPSQEEAPGAGSDVIYPSERIDVTDETDAQESDTAKKGGKTRVVKLSGNQADDFEEKEDPKQEDTGKETVESLLKENMSQAETPVLEEETKTPAVYPELVEDEGVDAKKIIFAALGIIIFLCAAAFGILWYTGVIHFGEKEEEED